MRRLISCVLSLAVVISSIFVSLAVLTNAAESDEIFTVDFEGKYSEFNDSNYLTDPSNTADTVNIGGENGTVMHIEQLRAYRPRSENHIVSNWAAAFFLADGNGNKASYEKGQQLSVSFKMKKNKEIDNEYYDKFSVGAIFDDGLNSVTKKGGNIGCINDYISDGRLTVVNTADCSKDEEWVSYSSVITVSNTGTAAFVVYGEEWTQRCDIYIDDIVIKKLRKGAINAVTDFEGGYSSFYQKNALTDTSNTADTLNIGGEHGTVMHIQRLRAYRPDFDENSRYYSVTNWAPAFFLADKNGNKISCDVGSVISVTFQMKKNSDIDDSDFQRFYAALIFDDELASKTAKENIGSLNDYINTDKAIEIASFDCKADKDWITYSSVITVPRTGTAAFVLYNNVWSESCDIYIDNIKLSSVDENATVDVNVHNFDGKGKTEVITLKESDIYENIETPFCPDKGFDGWYLDEALTKPANGFVGKTSDIYVKWRKDAFKTVNTYDEKNVEYIEEADGDYTLLKRKINGKPADEKYFSQYNALVTENEFDKKSGNSVKITVAHGYTFNWPATLDIYDSGDENLKVFTPKPNTAYRLKLKYKAEIKPAQALNIQIRRLAGDSKIQYLPENIVCESVVQITLADKDWVTVEKTFYTGDEVSSLALILCTVNSTTYGSSAEDVFVWVDDIEIEEQFNTAAIYFDTSGGVSVSKQPVAVGEAIPDLPIPKKAGCMFDGWFYDADCTKSFCEAVMPARNIRLYAKWKETSSEAYTLKKDFEKDEYINNGKNTNVSDSYMSSSAEWVNDPSNAYEGNGYIRILDTGAIKHSSSAMPAVSFLDENGNGYQLLEGKRYHLSFAARCSIAASHVLAFVSSEQIPIGGLKLKNATEEYVFSYGGNLSDAAMDEWGVYDFYFIAKNTGKLYLIVYGDGETAEISLDNFKIEETPKGEASLVSYYDDDGSLIYETYGKTGSWLADADINNKSGKEFDGWHFENGEVYLGNKFPKEDMSLYASWIDAEDLTNAKTDWSKDITVDFEDAEGAKAFYGVYNNSYEPIRGTFYVANDSQNAHSGNGYFKLYEVGVWGTETTWYRRFKLYDSNSLGNQIYLEPNSVYKVSYWLNVEAAGNSCIRLAAFKDRDNLIDCYYDGFNYLTDASEISNKGKWVKHESMITTGDEPTVLGMAISGGYFTAALDDVTVTKLKDVTVTFDTNGGSKIEPLTVLSYDYAIAPDFPEKEGYSFIGWFTDRSLTKRFRFNETQITSNITLYAKWEKDFVSETLTKTVTEYEKSTEEVENQIDDPELDNQIDVDVSDTPKAEKTVKSNDRENQSSFPWLIVIFIGTAVLICGATLLIVFIKKKNGGRV